MRSRLWLLLLVAGLAAGCGSNGGSRSPLSGASSPTVVPSTPTGVVPTSPTATAPTSPGASATPGWGTIDLQATWHIVNNQKANQFDEKVLSRTDGRVRYENPKVILIHTGGTDYVACSIARRKCRQVAYVATDLEGFAIVQSNTIFVPGVIGNGPDAFQMDAVSPTTSQSQAAGVTLSCTTVTNTGALAGTPTPLPTPEYSCVTPERVVGDSNYWFAGQLTVKLLSYQTVAPADSAFTAPYPLDPSLPAAELTVSP